MKKYFLLSLLFSGTGYVYSQSPSWIWARATGGPSYEMVYDICVDRDGNTYSTGSFSGTEITFGSFTLTNADSGFSELFIVKHDPDGNAVWAFQAGESTTDAGSCIVLDDSANVYVTGTFRDSILFGTTKLKCPAGNTEVFLVKMDSSGNLLQSSCFCGPASDAAWGLVVEPDHSVLLSGVFYSDTLKFNGSPFISTNAGSGDVFLIKFDAGGNVVWGKSGGGNGLEQQTYLTTDADGNIYLAGVFMSLQFLWNNITLTNTGARDVFYAKFDSNGNLIWAKSVTGSMEDAPFGIAADRWNNIYLTGTFSSPFIDVDGVQLSNTNPGVDIFLARLDSSGDPVWLTSPPVGGAIGNNYVHDVVCDLDGNCYITGIFGNPTITFGNDTLSNPGLFVAKYNSAGSALWAVDADNPNYGTGRGISIDQNNNVFVAGYYGLDSLIIGLDSFPNNGFPDAFIAKLGSTTGIEEANFKTPSTVVYPNPSLGVFTVRHSLPIDHVRLFTVTGQLISELRLQRNQISFQIEVGGVYLIQVVSQGRTSYEKVIVSGRNR